MVRIGTCPVCMQPVSIPTDLEAECRVRCPTCEAEYPLADVPVEAEPTAEPETPSDLPGTLSPGEFLKRLEQEAYGPQKTPSPPELIPVAAPSEEAEQTLPAAEGASLVAEDLRLAEEAPEAPQIPSEAQQPPESEQTLEAEEALSEALQGGSGEEESLLAEAGPEFQEEPLQDLLSPSGGAEAEAPVQPESEVLERSEAEPSAERPGLTAEELSSISGQEEPSEVYAPGPTETPGGQTALGEASAGEAPPGELPSAEGGPEPGQAEQAPPDTALEEAPREEVPPVDLDPLVRSPLSQEAFPLSQLLVQATGEPIGPVAAAMIVRLGLLRPLSEEEAAAMAPAPVAEAEAAAEIFDFSRLAAAGSEGAPGVPISARPRKRAEISPVKELVGIVLGGVVGLLIGYYILNIFWGPRYNFLKIYLPGVRHTYKYAPAWVPDWAKGGRESPERQEEIGPSEPSPNSQKNNKVQTGPKSKPSSPEGSAAANPSGAGEKPQPSKEPVHQPGPPSSGTSEKPAASKPKGKPSGKSAATSKPAKLQVLGAPSYTADDLAQAVQAVEEVFGCKRCHSTGQQTKTVTEVQQVNGQPKEVSRQISSPCEACQGKPPKAVTEESFERFCRLGEVLCFLSGPEDKIADRRSAVQSLLQHAAQEPANAEKIGPWAAARWQDAGRLSMGLLAAGKLGRPKQQGPWQLYELHLAGADRKLPLLLPTTPPAQPGDQVLVLGAIVEDPAQNLPGYPGKEPALLLGAEIVKTP
jgi:hypothetical protein